jgi:hypothetical protein
MMPTFSRKFVKSPLFGVAAIALGATVGVTTLASPLFDFTTAPGERSILDILTGRSPGERGSGALFLKKDKARHHSPRDITARRALDRRMPGRPGETSAPVADTASPLEALLWLPAPIPGWETPVPATPSSEGGPAPLGGSPGMLPIGGFVGGSGGAGGSGPNPLNPDTPTVPPVTISPHAPAVPEPQTWATMLLGLFACSAALRHRRRLALPSRAS